LDLYRNTLYIEDVNKVADSNICWDKLKGKSLLISGASGMVGSFFIDVILRKNETGLGCIIYALIRNEIEARSRFSKWNNCPYLHFVVCDVNKVFTFNDIGKIDYVLHLASNTHPIQYSTDPIGTIITNIIGLQNMLEFACIHHTSRFVFASSVEVYGENRGDVVEFEEDYCGYINSNTLRAGYPESKRCGEALCQAYRRQKGMDIVIARLARTYGPTMKNTDTKAVSQFIKKSVAKENIILKSMGLQIYSYTYVVDAVYGLLYILLTGVDGEAYNISDEGSNISLKDLAYLIANWSQTKVIYEAPDEVEAAGYSGSTKAVMNDQKIKALGWKPFYTIHQGILRTLDILRDH